MCVAKQNQIALFFLNVTVLFFFNTIAKSNQIIHCLNPNQIIHSFAKLVNSKSSAKPDRSKVPRNRTVGKVPCTKPAKELFQLSGFAELGEVLRSWSIQKTVSSFPNRPTSESWTRIFTLSSFLNYPSPQSRTVRKVFLYHWHFPNHSASHSFFKE